MFILAVITVFFIFFIVFLSIRRRSERIIYKIKRIILVESIYIVSVALIFEYSKSHRNVNFIEIFVIFFIIFIIFIKTLPKQKRSRYISAKTKQILIDNFERRTGKIYNSKEYEIHHIIPYSKGGNSTIDNLKIIKKEKNRKISNKTPWWDIFGK